MRYTTSRFAFILAAAATAAVPTRIRAVGAEQISVGIVPGDAAGVAFYAQELGLFKNAGLDVRLSVLGSGPATAAAVTGGSLDIGGVNTGSLVTARLRGVPLKIVSPAAVVPSRGPTGDMLMVRNDSTITTGADLNSKIVSTNALGTLQHVGALSWIDAHGGDAKSVRFVEIPGAAMVAALDAGRVDAAIMSEPFTSPAIDTHRSLGPLYEAMRRPFLIFELCATERWLQANAQAAARFAAATRLAAVWANAPEHERERRAMNVTLTKLDPQIIAKSVLWPMATALDSSMIQPVIDVMVKYGFLERSLSATDVIWQR